MAAHHNTPHRDRPGAPRASGAHPGAVDVPVLLARWRSREVWVARQFRACGGASLAEVEEVYDATVALLVERGEAYESGEHLRAALHRGIKMRALRLHRDRKARERALSAAAPVIESAGQDAAWRAQPERALIAHEDDVIVSEFIAELTPPERRVFALVADGRSWRAIATALELPETEARTLTRACERKRARFLSLYTTGRLCGYRSATIASLLAGRARGELALDRGLAHLRHCHACRLRHKTDADGLRAAFDARVISVLSPPVLLSSPSSLLDCLHAVSSRLARLVQRGTAAPGGARERAFEVVAGSGAGVKLAAGLASVALLAGGAVEAGVGARAGRHHRGSRATPALRSRGVVAPVAPRVVRAAPLPAPASRRSHRLPRPSQQYTPGGFSYLGLPSPRHSSRASKPVVRQRGGGPFGP